MFQASQVQQVNERKRAHTTTIHVLKQTTHQRLQRINHVTKIKANPSPAQPHHSSL